MANHNLYNGYSNTVTFGLAEQIFDETECAKILIGDTNVHFGIEDCTFDKYISNSAIYISIQFIMHQHWHHLIHKHQIFIHIAQLFIFCTMK